MKKISIIIVTYNSEEDIYDCLSSIRQWSDVPMEELEIIVVDNNSRDSQSMFTRIREQWGDGILLIDNPQNGGYGQGNNVGIRAASAPVVMVMNPDVRLYEPVFQKVIAAYENDPQLNLYGMKQMLTPERPSKKTTDMTYMMNGWIRAFLSSFMSRTDWYFPRWMFISGACFFVRKSAFEEVGLFDEENFMYGEEDDIRLRLQKRFGVHVRYDRSLHYLHLIKDRIVSAKSLVREAESCLLLYGKKGYAPKYILHRFTQNLCAVIAYHRLLERLGKRQANLPMELEALEQLKKMKHNLSK